MNFPRFLDLLLKSQQGALTKQEFIEFHEMLHIVFEHERSQK